ncbi:DUF3095 domain-containing protein [Catenovulum maritimum]|nr:DUF3095 domain-containing protein [Catenovulum maritimum]
MERDDLFYQELSGFKQFGMFAQTSWYKPIPEDWFIVVTDVINSTEAIKKGQYKQVNSIGVASIVALINAIKPLKIPYVFGGDGATACLPKSQLDIAKPALAAARLMAQEQFGLNLRIGLVSVAEIREHGFDVLVAKHQPHEFYQQAMFAGNGLNFAEKLIKEDTPTNPYILADYFPANDDIFDGFECRWNEIPSTKEETIALLIQGVAADDHSLNQIYQQILDKVSEIYGTESEYHPLKLDNLSLSSSFKTLNCEAGIRTAFKGLAKRLKYLLKLQVLRLVGIWLMAKKIKTQHTDWGKYKQQLLDNTDYQKFDDTLRMVIAGSKSQQVKLRQALDVFQQQDLIAYGIHSSSAALITCMVKDYNTDHVHFLDAANGGYAMAALELKRQLKNREK